MNQTWTRQHGYILTFRNFNGFFVSNSLFASVLYSLFRQMMKQKSQHLTWLVYWFQIIFIICVFELSNFLFPVNCEIVCVWVCVVLSCVMIQIKQKRKRNQFAFSRSSQQFVIKFQKIRCFLALVLTNTEFLCWCLFLAMFGLYYDGLFFFLVYVFF